MPQDKEKIAELIKAGRLAKGYTQLQLAELTNISLRSIQRIENAEVVARSYTLKRLADQLDVEFGIAGSSSIPTNSEHITKRSKTKKFILSVGLALLMLLLSAAFLSQAVHFPETMFEVFLFWFVVTAIYLGVLLRIWK